MVYVAQHLISLQLVHHTYSPSPADKENAVLHALKFDSPQMKTSRPGTLPEGKRGDSCGQFSPGCQKLTRGG